MGTTTHVAVIDGTPELLEALTRRLGELEAMWSRFIRSSEISALNAAPERWHAVSPETTLLLERARTGWTMTGGAFDPTVLDAVESHGYRRPLEEPALEPVSAGCARTAIGCASIEIDRATDQVRLGPGMCFDPGGVGKGLAADLLVGQALDSGAAGAIVNIGGDLACGGEPPASGQWLVELLDEGSRRTVIAVTQGGVATSTTRKRRWTTASGGRHHLVDRRSGANTSGVATATVIAASGWFAEVVAKQLIVDGAGAAIDTDRAAALVIDDDGRQHRIGDFERYER